MRIITVKIETNSEESLELIKDDIEQELSCCWNLFDKVEISEEMKGIEVPDTNVGDTIYRQAAIETLDRFNVFGYVEEPWEKLSGALQALPSAHPEEVIPHRNYKYLSDYWCECGWHLGKKGEVKYCSDCGRKVNWDG